MLLLLALACGPDQTTLGNFALSWDEKTGAFAVQRGDQVLLDAGQIAVGTGSAEVTFQTGSYLFEDVTSSMVDVTGLNILADGRDGQVVAELLNDEGDLLGILQTYAAADNILLVDVQAATGADRTQLGFACTGDDVFLGAGEHAFDVDHSGEAFALWVSEPGIGKVDSESQPDDWFLTGTRHASSNPVPFLLRPEEPVGLAVATWSRLELDLCKSDPDRFTMTTWEGRQQLLVFGRDEPIDIVADHALATGGVRAPPDWSFGPWTDAVGGPDRLAEVVDAVTRSGAPTAAIWTEDWRGGEELAVGYHPKVEWEVDRELYTDLEGTDAALEARGIKWLAYFSPFVAVDSNAWSEAADLVIRDPEGTEPYTFLGATLSTVSVVDVTSSTTWDWVLEKMAAAVAVGFDGWMADYGEWLPPDAVMSDGDALDDHNAYATLWHQLNAEAIDDAAALGQDLAIFGRSGWWGVQSAQPIHWIGDQRTSFDSDDGLPTVVPMVLGAAVSGVAFPTHDIGGYQSVGNDPSTRELWLRWCSLGAFTPIMRTHHGAFKDENWQFDTDGETLATWARYATIHTSLFPYLRGIAQVAVDTGLPTVLPPALLFPPKDHSGVSWQAIDAWMLGPSLYVAPVLEEGATSRQVDLPGGVEWTDWWTGARAEAGVFEAAVDEIPVFVPAGSIIPTFTTIPHTLVDFADGAERDDDIVDLGDADLERTITVVGTGGSFTEADGTTYTSAGTASEAGQTTATLSSGDIEVGGLTLSVSGTIERTYTVVVWP
jgi:sulfoquinovosidase